MPRNRLDIAKTCWQVRQASHIASLASQRKQAQRHLQQVKTQSRQNAKVVKRVSLIDVSHEAEASLIINLIKNMTSSSIDDMVGLIQF